MGHLGIEPRTYRLKAEYSTVELVALINNNNINSANIYRILLDFECIKWWKKKRIKRMNLNALSQLVTVFIILSIGPAAIIYFRKAL